MRDNKKKNQTQNYSENSIRMIKKEEIPLTKGKDKKLLRLIKINSWTPQKLKTKDYIRILSTKLMEINKEIKNKFKDAASIM